MNWYYVEMGQQAGPVTDEQLDGMLRVGKVRPDTLVWQEGMPAWVPCSQVKGGIPAGAPAETATEVACAECGNIFPVGETIRYGAANVCATCKPVFLQKIQEGAPLQAQAGQLNYAGFWIRFGAYFIDYLILLGVNMAMNLVVGLGALGGAPRAAIALQLAMMFLQFAIGICYEALMVGRYGATLGKMALKLQVVTADGGRVSYPRAFGRYFAKILSGLACLVGYIIAGFDNPEKRALHDHICNTRVVFKNG